MIAAAPMVNKSARDSAELLLGKIYHKGDDVAVDYERASHYFENILGRQSSEENRLEARYIGGSCIA